MKKFVKYLFVLPTSLLSILPITSCSCSQDQEESKDVIPESKLNIKNGVLSGFVDGFNPKEYKSLVIPNTVTTISASAFSGNFTGQDCLLTKITIPSSVVTIESKAFYGCDAITTYDLSSFTSVDGYSWASDAFTGSATEGEIVYPSVNTDIQDNIDYLLFDAGLAEGWFDFTKERTVDTKYLDIDTDNELNGFTDDYLTTPHTILYTKLSIPANVVRIHKNAFYDETEQTSKLRSINTVEFKYVDAETQYSNLESIGENVFRSSNLIKLNLKPGILSIGKSSFQDCKALVSITLPYTLSSIGESAFKGCIGLTEVTFSATMLTLGASAFNDCSNLSLINVEEFKDCPSTWNTLAFLNVANVGQVLCNPSYAQEWKSFFINSGLTNWTFTDKIDLLNGYNSLVQPYPIASSWTLSEISSYYYISLDSTIQILIDDLYHSFYEWTQTINEEQLTLSKFDMLIKNASVDTEYKFVSFNVYYDVEGTIKGTNEDKTFSTKGSWAFKNLPFAITSAKAVSTEGEEPRKFIKLVNNELATSSYWFAFINETYKIGTEEKTITNKEINKSALATITEYPLGEVGLFMNINKFLDYSDSTWTWGLLSSYLQNITIKE